MVDVIARRGSHASPLRYPGGKATLAGFFESTINALGLDKPTYIEPYAGGAGAGIELLLKGRRRHGRHQRPGPRDLCLLEGDGQGLGCIPPPRSSAPR